MRSTTTWLVGLSLLLGAGAAAAKPIDNIGNQGQVVFGVDRVMGGFIDKEKMESEYETQAETVTHTVTRSYRSYSVFGANADSSYAGHPRLAFDYFVAQGFSLGGSFVYLHGSGHIEDSHGAGIDMPTEHEVDWDGVLVHPRIGIGIQFDDIGALWPRVGVTYLSGAGDAEGLNSIDHLSLTGEVLLVFSPMKHFAILLGPYLDYALTGSMETEDPITGTTTAWDITTTSYGLTVSIVGYY